MVKMTKYVLAFLIMIAFAVPTFAQDDFPRFQLAPGYGNIGLKKLLPGRHSGFILDTNYNLTSKYGVDLFTGYYNIAANTTLYTNTFGGTAALRNNARVIPFGTAGFGFGYIQQNTSSGSFGGKAMGYRLGGGVDIPFHDSLAIRFDVTRMGFHFGNAWESGANYGVGIVLNLSQ